jgi:hypothetical protein
MDPNSQPSSENPETNNVPVPETIIVPTTEETQTPAPEVPAEVSAAEEPAPAAVEAPQTVEPTQPAVPQIVTTAVSDPTQTIVTGAGPEGPVSTTVSTIAPNGGGKKKKRGLFIVAAIVLILLLGGGYVFAIYLPNTPSGAYKRALSNTSAGYDKLVAFENTQSQKKYTGSAVSGKFNLSASGVSGDGTFTAQSDGANATGQVSLDLLGQTYGLNFRSIEAKGQSVPDIYLQVNGVKSLLDNYGLTQFDSLDGQWISIDHTVLQSLESKDSAASSAASTVMTPTQAQIEDALTRIGTVNKQYLFSTSTKYAVLVKEQYLGKSTLNGRSVYGYKMGYNKTNLEAYFTALGTSLDASSLNSWLEKTDGGKSFSSELSTANIDKSLSSADTNYTFDMYVDASTKLIQQFHFADTTNPAANYLNLGLDYTGGNTFPFIIESKSTSGSDTLDAKITASLNTDTSKVGFQVNVNGTEGGSPITFSATLNAAPTNTPLTVTAPAGAEPITTLLQSTGLSSLLGAGGSSSSALDSSSSIDPVTFTQ